MTATDEDASAGDTAPPPVPPPPTPPRPRLRRSLTDRYGVGLCGGLGRYFGVDPVIFRVLFVVLSFFGALGIVAYLVGYALIPEEGAPTSNADRFVDAVRRRRISPVLLAIAAVFAVLVWSATFSWWLPTPFVASVAIVGVLVYFATRHRPAPFGDGRPWPAPTGPAATPATSSTEAALAPSPPSPDLRSPRREAARQRRAASRPVRWITWAALIGTWTVMALVDRTAAVPLKTFAWSGLLIVVAGFAIGALWRRPSWTLLVLLPPLVATVAVFGESEARLADGTGDKAWRPSSPDELEDEYGLAFGRTTLDLTDAGITSAFDGRSIRIDHGAGEVVVRIPADLDVDLHADVQAGEIVAAGRDWDGWGVERTLRSQGVDGEGGGQLDLDVELAAGVIRVVREAG